MKIGFVTGAMFLALMMAGCSSSASSNQGRIPPHPTLPPTPQYEPTPLDQELMESAKKQLLDESMNTNPSLAAHAIEAISQVAPELAGRPVLSRLSDPSALVRFSAIIAAGQIKLSEAHQPLLDHLQDSDVRVQVAVRYALHRLGDTRYSHDLEKFSIDGDPAVRGSTAQVLGMLKEPSAAKILVHMLADQSAEVRLEAAEALWRMGDQRGLEDLVAGSISGFPDEQFDSLLALAEPRDISVAGHIRGQLDSDYPEVSLAAARALGMLGMDNGFGLAAARAKSQVPLQRMLAALALGAIGRSDAQPILGELLRDHDPQVRVAAAEALLQLHNPDDRAHG